MTAMLAHSFASHRLTSSAPSTKPHSVLFHIYSGFLTTDNLTLVANRYFESLMLSAWSSGRSAIRLHHHCGNRLRYCIASTPTPRPCVAPGDRQISLPHRTTGRAPPPPEGRGSEWDTSLCAKVGAVSCRPTGGLPDWVVSSKRQPLLFYIAIHSSWFNDGSVFPPGRMMRSRGRNLSGGWQNDSAEQLHE